MLTWTSMISSYVQHGSFQLALGLFKEMLASNEMPNHYTLSVAVRTCTVVLYVDLDVQIHGLAQDGDTSEVLRILSDMQVVDGLNPNDSTIVGLLKCYYILKEVEQVHGLALKTGFKNDIAVSSSFMDSYGKLGSIDLGQKILDASKICEVEKLFRRIDDKYIVAWNAMITATSAYT
ncbi:hypothetical protein RJ639_005097 [Escallonia herrerae]|uniref:Pentatricopeptide repeat-containing protein n=1 Tax=Escallonia herrerae TaxID=1293975 RepID=A0AA88VZS6_9ASTE|nr:hypothetical protein RJ639_005097 [Escallonia herrerae]